MTTNLEQLIKDEQAKHAAKLKKLREQVAKEEQELLLRVARLVEQHEPEQFAQYCEHATSLIEQERAARACKQQEEQSDVAAYAGDGGGSE